MSSVALFSAKGAPGVTTTAMLLASLWERPTLLADCDPAGGDVALRLPAPDGRPLDLGRGMLSLLSVARRAVEPSTLVEHAQAVLGGGLVIAGLSGPEQAVAAAPMWPTLAGAVAALDSHDMVLDVGRLDVRSPVLPLVMRASLAVCVVDATLPGVYAARSRLRALVPELSGAANGPPVGFVVHAAARREADEIAAAIGEDLTQVQYLGHVAHDPHGARIFNGQPVSRPERTLLVRSGGELAATIGGVLYARDWSASRDEDAWSDGTPVTSAGHRAPTRAERRAAEAAAGRRRRRREHTS